MSSRYLLSFDESECVAERHRQVFGIILHSVSEIGACDVGDDSPALSARGGAK